MLFARSPSVDCAPFLFAAGGKQTIRSSLRLAAGQCLDPLSDLTYRQPSRRRYVAMLLVLVQLRRTEARRKVEVVVESVFLADLSRSGSALSSGQKVFACRVCWGGRIEMKLGSLSDVKEHSPQSGLPAPVLALPIFMCDARTVRDI